MPPRLSIEGYVIVSADGMLADLTGVMPSSLKFDADLAFFTAGLNRADLIVHGRGSFEDQPRSPERRRIMLTRATASLDRDPQNPKCTLWNPLGASFEEACALAGVTTGVAAVIGGPSVFEMFLPRTDTFWLSQAHNITLPGGEGAFPGVPEKTPQQVLASYGLKAAERRDLDVANRVDVTPWRRS